jgi:hypothetical protein
MLAENLGLSGSSQYSHVRGHPEEDEALGLCIAGTLVIAYQFRKRMSGGREQTGRTATAAEDRLITGLTVQKL